MKTVRFTTLLIILCVQLFVLGSCATMIPEKIDANDCLVIIRTVYINNTKYDDARTYKLFFNNDIRPALVDEGRDSFLAIRVTKPGGLVVKLHSEMSQLRGSFTGDSFDRDVDFDLPYEAGKAVIADFAFVRRLEKDGRSDFFNTYYDFKMLTKEEKQAILELPQCQKIIAKWETKNRQYKYELTN